MSTTVSSQIRARVAVSHIHSVPRDSRMKGDQQNQQHIFAYLPLVYAHEITDQYDM